jgi:Ni,Fe-hydrogenase III large subunit/Ni,Fe-hydrogenase III component G
VTAVRPGLAGEAPGLRGEARGLPGLLSELGRDAAAAHDPVVTLSVAGPDLEAAVRRLAAFPGARLADVFASGGNPAIGGDPVVLRLVWGLDSDQRYLVTESVIEGERYPQLSDIAPAAFHEECEIYEQFGIRPEGGKSLNRVALPPQAGPEILRRAPGGRAPGSALPRLGRAPAEPPAEVHAPHVVGGHAFEFPFGPVRQAGVESLYYGLVTSGEEIVDLYLFTWHKHRGVEWRMRGRTPREALFQVERTEGLGAVGAGWAFAAAAEAALEVEPPGQAMRARAVALELERLYNHAAATAALCQSTGLAVGQAAAEIALERLLRLNAAAFGHRYLFGVVDIGGARRGPDATALRRELPGAYGELRHAADALLATNSFVDRLEATGILTQEAARRLGMVGPVARATGLTTDARADHPAGPYAGHPPEVATGDGGDVLARFRVMLAEAAESVRLIGEFLQAGAGPGLTESPEGIAGRPGRSGLGWAESSRGEALAWVALDGSGRITRARLRPASVRNWRGFDDACRSQNVFTDIPIIEASFWLTVAGTSR